MTLGKLTAALIAAGVLAAGLALPFVGGVGLVAGHEADKFQNTTCNLPATSKPPQRTTLYARDNKTVLATLFTQDRVPVPLSQVPQYLQDALVATEDRRFYSHHGVDMRGLLRSAVNNTTSGDTQGGSTLTMQYVKQIRYYLAGNDPKKQQAAISQNLNRKIEDAKCALYIENSLKESKHEILQNYLNIAFFGENAYSLQTAARTYFNKPASQLSLNESAMLVGLLRAPSAYDPFQHRQAATERRNEVLQNLVAVGKLSQAAANKQKAQPIALASNGPPQVRQGCASSVSDIPNVGFFCEYTQQWLEDVDGLSERDLQQGGLRIVTTLDPDIQKSAQQGIQKAVPASSPYTSVLPTVDPRTGDVLAMAASKQFGTGDNETEQPLFTKPVAFGASTYKLFPLLAALQTGMQPDWTLLTDGNDGLYKPKNCAIKGKGVGNGDANVTYNPSESLKSATADSSNTFYLGMTDQFFGCHLDSIIDVAKKLGITTFDAKTTKTQTLGQEIIAQQQAQRLVLGSVATSPLQLAGAYAGVANMGKFNAPSPVLSVTDSDGSALRVKRSPGTQVIPAQTAAQAVDILQGDTHSGGTSAGEFDSYYGKGGSPVAGKTGTAQAIPTSKNGAIWFVGMTPTMTAASALIDFDNSSAPSSGLPHVKAGQAYGDYASKVWLKALGPSLQGKDWSWTDSDEIDGTDVPNVVGESLSKAQKDIEGADFKFAQLGAADDLLCPSAQTLETVGYAGPTKAPPGTTITVCKSSGKAQVEYPAPPPSTGNNGNGHGNGHGNGGGDGGNGNGGGGHGGGNGGGNGGGGNGGGGGHGGGGGGHGGGGGGGGHGGGHH